ncbi:MAG: carboxypeptidase-like regulatory domain-containing protein [Bacteroidetes bacterium]|nr:carboxypeptidase-like regulatory domain-containing protein [Bacteroidota bacterium]
MANDNNIPAFSAADIEKYHKGLLSNTERHALEKAALDDPFLADALEGYALPGINAAADIALLKEKLAVRVDQHDSRVVPMSTGPQRRIPWLRAAVAVLIIGGAGLLANQLIFTNKDKGGIAKADQPATPAINTPDSALPTEKDKAANTGTENNTSTTNTVTTTLQTEAATDKPSTLTSTPEGSFSKAEETKSTAGNPVNKPAPITDDMGKALEEKNRTVPAAAPGVKDVAAAKETKTAPLIQGTIGDIKTGEGLETDADRKKDEAERSLALKRRADETSYRNQRNNIFRGRVTDANNAGVPFANVTNIEDKAGTYTDANGYFNFTSPDTVLNVQIKSIGFSNNQVQLRNTQSGNKIVLHEDRNLSTVVISNQKPNVAARNRDANRTLLEPEPADGWENYDAYLVNNLEVPEDIKSRQNANGSVQVSFEVDKYGEPINIKVEKSLCDKCDQEAIRLIKNGPKWKRKAAAKGRTTVTVNF